MKISVKELNQLLNAERERIDVLTLTLYNLRQELDKKDCVIKDLELLAECWKAEQCD